MKKPKKPPCTCGARLPHHLAEIAGDDDRYTHVCSCERAYKVREGAFVLVGTEPNPIARYEAASAPAKPMSAPRKPRKPLRPVRDLPRWMIEELAASRCVCAVIKPDRVPCTSCVAQSILGDQAPPRAAAVTRRP